MKFSNPIGEWRRRNSVEHSSRWVGEHAGYDNTPLPRLTWKGFWMGILVSMGKSIDGELQEHTTDISQVDLSLGKTMKSSCKILD